MKVPVKSFANLFVCVLVCAAVGFASAAYAGAATNAALGVRIAAAARQQVGVTKEYDSSYTKLDYPGGDVPLHTGVRCDVVVRALHAVNLDLQKEVHEDMAKDFSAYP